MHTHTYVYQCIYIYIYICCFSNTHNYIKLNILYSFVLNIIIYEKNRHQCHLALSINKVSIKGYLSKIAIFTDMSEILKGRDRN